MCAPGFWREHGLDTRPARSVSRAGQGRQRGHAKLADGRQVAFPGSGKNFLEPHGTLSGSLFPDLLHPNEKGGRIWRMP
jgi:hypothetical protein